MKAKHRSGKPGRASVLGTLSVLAVLATALLAGCGGSGGSESSSEESSAASSERVGGPGGFAGISEEARSCLKERGVELPEPGQGAPPAGGPPEGTPPEGGSPRGFGKGGAKMKKAFEECGVELPRGKPGGPPIDSGAFRKWIKEYVACMGENGYELPEPNLSGEGPVFKESEVDREGPKFKAANEKCQSRLGVPGAPPGRRLSALGRGRFRHARGAEGIEPAPWLNLRGFACCGVSTMGAPPLSYLQDGRSADLLHL